MRRRVRFVGSAHSLEKKKQTNKEMGGLKVAVLEKRKKWV